MSKISDAAKQEKALLQAQLDTAKQEVAKLDATKASTTTPATTSGGEGGKSTPAKTTPTGAQLPNKDKLTEVVKTINKNKVVIRDSNDNVEKEIIISGDKVDVQLKQKHYP